MKALIFAKKVMDIQEQMFSEVEAWRSSGMVKQDFVKVRVVDIQFILCQRQEDYNQA
jgi:hypothetical protein